MVRRLVRMQQKGQVTLPAAVRRELNLKQGDLIAVEVIEDGILITPQIPVSTVQYKEHDLSLADLLAQGTTMREKKAFVLPIPSAEEVARRAAVIDEIMAGWKQRPSIAPLTTADLVHMARAEEGKSFDPGA